MIYSKTKYIFLAIEDWLDNHFIDIIIISIALFFTLLVALLHFKAEEKWYNEQITVWSNLEENYKWINKNY